ncbi:M56 family metallopeptidase [Clostridiaceae bacterium OttesenSCG-928-D20]|nr:M56 family metallopeptidase [Clostridiaceae bacterium OttesenSCG-928-D20]
MLDQINNWLYENNLLFIIYKSPLFFFLLAFMLKCLIISLYAMGVYALIRILKVFWGEKMSIRSNYAIWAMMFASLPLSVFGWNDAIKYPVYEAYLFYSVGALLLYSIMLIWYFNVFTRRAMQMFSHYKMRRAISALKPYADENGLGKKAMLELDVQSKNIFIALADVQSPVSYGARKKTILLPMDFSERYSLDEQYLLLLHELGHIKNHDTLKLYIFNLLECFIPLPKCVLRDFKRDTELLCDNRVMGASRGAENSYGELILRECRKENELPAFAFSQSFYAVKARLDALYLYKPEKHKTAFFGASALITLALMLILGTFNKADWIIFNDDYNKVFDIWIDYAPNEPRDLTTNELVEISSAKLETLGISEKDFSDVYATGDGQIYIDKMSLFEVITPFVQKGNQVYSVGFSSLDYSFNTLGQGGYSQEYHSIEFGNLASATEENRYHVADLANRGFESRVLRFVAKWF